jgi:hypothetical protein
MRRAALLLTFAIAVQAAVVDAAKHRDLAGVRALIAKHAAVDEQQGDGATADPNIVRVTGETPLMTASHTGDRASVKLLLAHIPLLCGKQQSGKAMFGPRSYVRTLCE